MTAPETTTPIRRSIPGTHPFARLITLVGDEVPRRRVLQGLFSAAVGALSITRQLAPAAAKRCKGVGKRCGTNRQCCSAFCDPLTRQCVATCAQGEGICGTLTPCAPGCSCYRRAFASEQVCLRDPADPPACASLQLCLDSDDECPRGHVCTASSCCGADAVCIPVCEVMSG